MRKSPLGRGATTVSPSLAQNSRTSSVGASPVSWASASTNECSYAPPEKPTFRLPGASGRVALVMAAEGFHKRGMATDYDMVVSDRLATVLSGGEADLVDTVTEDQLLTLERRTFMAAVKDPRTIARIETMLTTGKPLRN